MGYKVIALDGESNSEGFKYADQYYVVDLKNKTEILKIAKKHNIKAIIPSPIGSILSNVGFLNDQLGLKGISEEAALNCTDKKKLNEKLRESISLARQVEAIGYEQIKEAIKKIGLPCILKPRTGSGSKGVITILEEQNIEKSIKIHMNDSTSKESLIEEFIEGKEYGIDGIVENGVLKIIMHRDKTITKLPYRQEVAYMAPSSLIKEDLDIIQDYLDKICKKLKLNHCLIHCDLIYDNGRPYLIEISGRPAGLKISEKLVMECISLNIIENAINYMLDKDYTFYGEVNKNVLLQFIDIEEGKVLEIPNKEELLHSNIVDYNSNINVGDITTTIKNGVDLYKRGYFILSSKDRKKLYEESIVIKNRFKVKSNN